MQGPPLPRQRAELGGARCGLRRAGGQDRLTRRRGRRAARPGTVSACGRTTSQGTIAENYDRDSPPSSIRRSSARDGRLPGGARRRRRRSGAGHRHRAHCAAAVGARRAGARDRPVTRHGGAAAGEARGRCHRGDHRRLRHDRGAGAFRLAYLVYNTIENLTSQDDQVACFVNVGPPPRAGRMLRHRGGGAAAAAAAAGGDGAGLQGHAGPGGLRHVRRGPSSVGVSHHYWVGAAGADTFSMPYRYVWPAELDLMARIGGMRLRERWSDWHRRPFTGESGSHVSVWEKPAARRTGRRLVLITGLPGLREVDHGRGGRTARSARRCSVTTGP